MPRPKNGFVVTGLRLYRLAAGESQTSLAKAIHVPPVEVGYMEQGRLIPSQLQATRLQEFFGVDIDKLMKVVRLDDLLAKL